MRSAAATRSCSASWRARSPSGDRPARGAGEQVRSWRRSGSRARSSAHRAPPARGGRSRARWPARRRQRAPLVAELAGIDPERPRGRRRTARRARSSTPDAVAALHPPAGAQRDLHADMPAGERARAHARAAALLRGPGASPEQIATQLLAAEQRATRRPSRRCSKRGSGRWRPGPALGDRLSDPGPARAAADGSARGVLDPLLTASFRAADQRDLAAAVEAGRVPSWMRDPSLRSPLGDRR